MTRTATRHGFIQKLLNHQIIRFGLVGIVNTLIDIILFVSLRFAGIPIVIANILSTSAALAVSLLLNYRYTFKGRTLTRGRIAIYISATISGLWILQPIIIKTLTSWNTRTHVIETLTRPLGPGKLFVVLAPKLVSIACTLLWNYFWYSKVVFSEKSPAKATDG